MNIGFSKVPQVAEGIFGALQKKDCISVDDGGDETIINLIMNILHSDLKLEERTERDAARLIEQKQNLVDQTDATEEEILNEVKRNIARTKGYIFGKGAERAESQTNKIIKALWKNDEIDFFVDDNTLRLTISDAIMGFCESEADIYVRAREQMAKHHSNVKPDSDEYRIFFDKELMDLRSR